jgi:hypothetical protein
MGKKRGAPTKPPESRKTKIFPVRVTEREYAWIEAASGNATPSAWARKLLVSAAKRKAGDSNPSAKADPTEGL